VSIHGLSVNTVSDGDTKFSYIKSTQIATEIAKQNIEQAQANQKDHANNIEGNTK